VKYWFLHQKRGHNVSTHYLAYWKPETVREDLRTKEPVYHAGSDQFSRVVPGDHLWFITTSKPNRLVLVSHMDVRKIVTHKEAVRIAGPNIWNASLPAQIVWKKVIIIGFMLPQLHITASHQVSVDEYPASVARGPA
jgi:hypothetical protein